MEEDDDAPRPLRDSIRATRLMPRRDPSGHILRVQATEEPARLSNRIHVRVGKSEPAAPPEATAEATPVPIAKPRSDRSQQIDQSKKPKQSADPEGDAALLGAARNAAKLRRWDDAVSRFESYLSRHAADPQLEEEYAGVLVQAGRYAQAAVVFRRLLESQPDNLRLRIILADVLVSAKDYKAAIGQLLQVLQQHPAHLGAATKLVRAYVFDEDFARAIQLYDTRLRGLKPNDPETPRLFGAMLLDLGWPTDALPFLLAQREKRPTDPEVVAGLVNATTRIGRKDQAAEWIGELARIAPRDVGIRLELAEGLQKSDEFELAALVYQQVLQIDPDHPIARYGIARVYLARFEPQKAKQALESFAPPDSARRVYGLTWAEYYQHVGEYTEAKQLYQDLLRHDPNDDEARVSLGYLYKFIRESEKAKAEFAKIPAKSTLSRKARIFLAATLTDQRRFNEAEAACQLLLAENPADGAAAAQLVTTLGKDSLNEQAVAFARNFLSVNARNEVACFGVRLALAKVLLDAGYLADAHQEYQRILGMPGGRIPAAYYGAARAMEQQGAKEAAGHIWNSILPTLTGAENRNRLVVADLFSADYLDSRALPEIQNVVSAEPDNLAALIRLADAQLRLARLAGCRRLGCGSDPDQTARSILAISPKNVRGHLVNARAKANYHEFQEAADAYEAVIRIDPTFSIPVREKARVLFSDHQFDAATAVYSQLESPSAAELLEAELNTLADREPLQRAFLASALRPGLPADALRERITIAQSHVTDDNVREELRRLNIDYCHRAAFQLAVKLEKEAKEKKDLRNREAIGAYTALINVEPDNVEGLFDLGQVYGVLRRNAEELPQYGHTLRAEPIHREAMVASERSNLEIQPWWKSYFQWSEDRGRDGLTNVARLQMGSWLYWPCGDEDEYVAFGYERRRYSPGLDRPLDGNMLSIRGQKKSWTKDTLFYGQLNYEQFQDRIHDRATFDVGVQHAVSDMLTLRGGLYLQNVVENGESIRQDLYKGGVNLGADVHMTRKWSFGGTYTYASYSDNNYSNEIDLYNDYSITLPPEQLKFVLLGQFLDYKESTIFPEDNNPELFGTVHPYFAPQNYYLYQARIEWYHWCSCDYFVHSNQCWFSLQYGITNDSNFVLYHNFRALGLWDVKPWLTIGGEAKTTMSSVYKNNYVGAYLVLRNPWGCR